MVQAISACPMTITELIELTEKIENGEVKVDDVIDGLIDPDADDEEDQETTSATSSNFDEDDEDDEEARAALQAANLETLRVESLERLSRIKASFTKMMRALARGGTTSPGPRPRSTAGTFRASPRAAKCTSSATI